MNLAKGKIGRRGETSSQTNICRSMESICAASQTSLLAMHSGPPSLTSGTKFTANDTKLVNVKHQQQRRRLASWK